QASNQLIVLKSSSCMATIISSHKTTVAMMNSIHTLLSENHPCTSFMASLHPGYHAPIEQHKGRARHDPLANAALSPAAGSSPTRRTRSHFNDVDARCKRKPRGCSRSLEPE